MPAHALIYRYKFLSGSAVGRVATDAAKYAAGLYFDACLKEYRTGDLSFTIPPQHSTRSMRGRFAVDTYELPERRLAEKYIKPESTVLELGGCIGVVSCCINQQLNQRGNHVVVEANPNLIDALRANRDRNGCGFEIVNAALSRSSSYYVSTDRQMDSNVPSGAASGVRVPTVTVERLEESLGTRFDTLVMDIEGGEYAVMQENPDLPARLACVIIELHPHLLPDSRNREIREWLASGGLRKAEQLLTVECWTRA